MNIKRFTSVATFVTFLSTTSLSHAISRVPDRGPTLLVTALCLGVIVAVGSRVRRMSVGA